MDQFGEMSKTKQVVHAETSERGTAGKGTLYGTRSKKENKGPLSEATSISLKK